MRGLTLAFALLCCLGLSADMSWGNEIAYEKQGRRDPFEPLIGPDGITRVSFNTEGFHVEGIIHDPRGESLVLLNGEFYKEGAVVENATVVKIHNDRVVLQQEEEEKILWLQEETPKGGAL